MLRISTIAAIAVALPINLTGCSASRDPAAATAAVAQARSPATASVPFRATGNEPGWRLDIDSRAMTLLTNFGQDRLVAAMPVARVSGGATTYVARADQGELTATIVDRLCLDSMSGMPHPQSVTVVVGGKTLTGCGGEPASLLQAAEWTVVEIDGAPLAPGSRATLDFAPDGVLSGQASCNSFTAAHALSGEGLGISRVAGSRMMCDAALMYQERRFLEALGSVQGFSVAADGALLLRSGDGRSVKARRR